MSKNVVLWIYIQGIFNLLLIEQSDESRPLFSPIWVSEQSDEILKAIAIVAFYIIGISEKFPII